MGALCTGTYIQILESDKDCSIQELRMTGAKLY